MKKKISKRMREEAANLCSAEASWWATKERGAGGDVPGRRDVFGAGACAIADAALIRTASNGSDSLLAHVHNVLDWAEAEAMIREGWTP